MAGPVDSAQVEESAYRAIFEASSDGLVINDAETGVVVAANPAFCAMHGYENMLGLHPRAFIHPDSHPLFDEFVSAIRGGREFRTRARDVRRDGSVFDVEVLGRPFVYEGRAAMLGVVRDISDDVRAYHQLEQLVAARTREIEQRRAVAEALSELLTVVNSGRTLNEMLAAILEQAARLLGSDAEGLYLLEERDPGVLRLEASRNLPPEGELASLPLGTPVVGLAAQRLKPVVALDLSELVAAPIVSSLDEQVEDRGTYLELVRRGPASAQVPDLLRRNRIMAEQFRSLVAVPLMARECCHGSLLLAFRNQHAPSDEELDLVRAFAGQAGLAIETARLQQDVQRRRQDLEALYQADQALHRSLRLDEVLNALIDLPVAIGQAEMVSLLLWDDQQHRFVVGGVRGLSDAILREAFTLEEARIARTATGDLVEVVDAETDPRVSHRLRATITREGVRAWISSPIRIAGHLFGSFSFGFGRPHQFTDRERRLLVALAQRAALAIQNARLHEESELQREELQGLYEADEALHRSLRLQDVLDALVDAAITLLHADSSGLWSVDPLHKERPVPLAWRGLSDAYVEAATRMSSDPAVLDFWWGPDTFSVEDVRNDPRIPPLQRAALEREGCMALLSTRMHIDDRASGSFTVGYRASHTFSDREQRLLAALAQRAGLAIQNARLYEQAQQAATLQERQRLARELHDAVTQTLFSTALIADVLPALWDLDPAEGVQRLGDLRRLTRGALAEMRTLLVELRPGALTEFALGDLLRQLAEATAGRTRLEVATNFAGPARPLPSNVHVALYRLAQEALNNVVKHARAQHAAVELTFVEDGVFMHVVDDGRGFEPEKAAQSPGHFGLGIMRERAASIGATLRIVSEPGAGTRVHVSWHDREDTAG